MTHPLRNRFDRELAGLTESVLVLGSTVRGAVAGSLVAFMGNDDEAAGEVITGDTAINAARFSIEQECYALLAREQPVAGDMRAILSALTITSELERIGDHAKKIARICQRTACEPRFVPADSVQRLGEIALAMLDEALKAVAARDIASARTVCGEDDKADALYKQTFNLALSYMLESPRAISGGTYLIQAAHELERIADRATNIAERVIYSVSGELVDLNV